MQGKGERMGMKPWSLRHASVRMFALGCGRMSALAKKVGLGVWVVTAEHERGRGGRMGSGGAKLGRSS